MSGGGALSQYSSLLHSPHNKRKSYSTNNKAQKSPKTGSVNKPSKKTRASSPQKCSAARKLDLQASPTKKLDLRSPRYFTSPENDEVDFTKPSQREKPNCSPIKESTSAAQRQAAIDQMIEERKATSPLPKSPKKKENKTSGTTSPGKKERLSVDRENVWEARRNEALLDAGNIERGILKDILFSETTRRDTTMTRTGPVYKEILSPRQDMISSKSTSPRTELNDLTLPDSEVENNSPRDTRQNRDSCLTPEKRDMSSSYKEDDFISTVHRRREDKSINTSPVRWDTPPARRDTTPRASPTRSRSPKKTAQKKRHSEDTLDTISDLESRYCEVPGSPNKVSFSEDTVDRNLKIHRLERDVQQRDLELLEMKQLCHQFKQRLGESETLRIALESEKLRLSLQNITQSPRAYNMDLPPAAPLISSTPAHVTSSQHHVTSSQHHMTSPQHNVTSQDGAQEERIMAPIPEQSLPPRPNVSSVPESNIQMGENLTNACNDITEVNTMILQMKLENDALKAGLKEASIKTQQQTRQLEDRLQNMEKEKDRIAEENRRYQRLIAQDDKGSRIAMLQRDLQNQMSENEKLKHHLQSLRENYTKFFGASI